MKKLVITLLLLLPAVIFAQETKNKAFGTVYFGMSKQEAKEAIKADKTTNAIEIGGYEFLPLTGNFKYDDNGGLVQVKLGAFAKPGQNLYSINTSKLLQDIDKVFTGSGYNISYKHFYFPDPKLMVGDKAVLIYFSTEKSQYIVISIPLAMPSGSDSNYEVHIDVIFKEYFDAKLAKEYEKLKAKTEEVKSKF